MPAPVRWAGQVLLWMLILGFLVALAVGVLIPRIAGATPYTILTGSMEPSLPPGTLVVDKPADIDAIRVGTVLTYQLRSGEPEVVTHRVTSVSVNLEGEKVFTTQGDANPVADENPVRPEQIRGQLWYAVPHLGRASVFFTGHQKQLLTYGVAGALGLYALGMFAGATRDRRRASRTTPTSHLDVSEREQESCVV